MNKFQKELLQESLKSEKRILSDLRKTYEQAEKDIDERLQALLNRFNATDDANLQRSIIYQMDYQKALKQQVSGILDSLNGRQFESISDYIQKSYEDGFIGTLYDLQGQGVPLIFPIDQEQVTTAIAKETKLSKSLYSALGEDVADLKKRVQNELSRGIAQNHSYAEIAKNIRNQTRIGYNRAARIARTEGHRVQQAAQADAQLKAKEAGADVVKQWDATLDGRTRNAHRTLDGQVRELDEPFEINGNKAMYPGNFGIPGQDIHCRCVTLTRARWAVDDETGATKFDNETGQLVEIESKSYQDFKKKYWKSLDKSTDQSNNGGAFSDSAYTEERKANALRDTSGGQDFDKEYRSQSGEIWRNATDEQKDAIVWYSDDGFVDINENLRNGKPDADAMAIRELIDKSTFTKDTWLQRGDSRNGFAMQLGIDGDEFLYSSEGQMKKKLIGKTFTKKDFTSTGSAMGTGLKRNITSRIYCPAGTKGLYMEPFASKGMGGGRNWDGISTQRSFSTEDETILQSNTTFRITDVKKTPAGKWEIETEVIGQ